LARISKPGTVAAMPRRDRTGTEKRPRRRGRLREDEFAAQSMARFGRRRHGNQSTRGA